MPYRPNLYITRSLNTSSDFLDLHFNTICLLRINCNDMVDIIYVIILVFTLDLRIDTRLFRPVLNFCTKFHELGIAKQNKLNQTKIIDFVSHAYTCG